ncbi:hypothetical protein MASR2M66_27830 [Chloroflexota bacterium]
MTDLNLSLQITALGMGLVFGAILLLWLMMVILTMLTADKSASDSVEVDSPAQTDSRLQAAILAVTMALMEQDASSAHPLEEPPTAIVSAWQLGMRTRQMSDKGNFRRH